MWRAPSRGDGERGELHAYVQCDTCLPPQVMIGSAEDLIACGWRFADLEAGPHTCPTCPQGPWRRPRRVRRLSPPSKRPALPTMLVIGAEKCGTTSLHNYLALHPEIDMAQAKELNFFQDPDCLQNLEEYATFFDADRPVRGESSPTYSAYPLLPGVAERIAATIPEARLIYIVRDPVERAIADYAQFSRLWLARSPQQAFAYLSHPYHVYMAPGRYGAQVERYLAAFPAEQLLVIDQADLLANRRDILAAVFRFLDVDESFVSPGFDDLANTRDSIHAPSQAGRWLRRTVVADATRHLPSWSRRALLAAERRLAAPKVEPSPPVVDDQQRRQLRAAFRDDVARLRQLTGKRFATWQV